MIDMIDSIQWYSWFFLDLVPNAVEGKDIQHVDMPNLELNDRQNIFETNVFYPSQVFVLNWLSLRSLVVLGSETDCVTSRRTANRVSCGDSTELLSVLCHALSYLPSEQLEFQVDLLVNTEYKNKIMKLKNEETYYREH